MPSRSYEDPIAASALEKGQRLYCGHCGSEIEVVNPCPCTPPDQEFRCCGEPMRPNLGAAVNVNVEAEMA